MADILVQQFETVVGQFILGLGNKLPTPQLKLFTNPWNFCYNTALTDLVECVAPGYKPISLTPAFWVQVAAVGDGETWDYPQVTFGITGNGGVSTTVYGHFFYDPVNKVVMWGQQWTTPWAIPSVVSQNPQITPQFSFQNCTIPACTPK